LAARPDASTRRPRAARWSGSSNSTKRIPTPAGSAMQRAPGRLAPRGRRAQPRRQAAAGLRRISDVSPSCEHAAWAIGSSRPRPVPGLGARARGSSRDGSARRSRA
jgi:hypothetical protein